LDDAAFLAEISRGHTVQDATKNLGLDWQEVQARLRDVDFRQQIVDLAVEANEVAIVTRSNY